MPTTITEAIVQTIYMLMAILTAVFAFWTMCESNTIRMNYYPLNTTAGWNELSESEQRFYMMIAEHEGESVWGYAIRKVIREQSISRFRQLICELKDQAEDEPDTMKAIIGHDAYEVLMSV